MGADYANGYGTGRTPDEAFREAHDEAAWECGHGGYTGTLAEKDSYIYFGRLPARMTPERFEQLASDYDQFRQHGFWEESIYKKNEHNWTVFDRRIKHRTDPRPKSLRTPEFASMLIRWFLVADGDKWGPAAAVRLNGKDEREHKALHGHKHTRAKAYFFAGYCSS